MRSKASSASDRYGSPADLKIKQRYLCRVLMRLVVLTGVSY
jgi:hypothetical protein